MYTAALQLAEEFEDDQERLTTRTKHDQGSLFIFIATVHVQSRKA
jgi:hypothetical protein